MIRKIVIDIMIVSSIIVVISLINNLFPFVSIPNNKEMIDIQLNFITINSVFAGFSFTSLGLLLGLSPEKLIRQLENTGIIERKACRLIITVILMILSILISFLFVLGIDKMVGNFAAFTNILYILGLGYMIAGIICFVYCLYEFSDLLKNIYRYNRSNSKNELDSTEKDWEIKKSKIQKINYDDDE